MKYTDLTLDQRISLKGEFQVNPKCINYRMVMLLWGFIEAVEYFLNDDLSILTVGYEEKLGGTYG